MRIHQFWYSKRWWQKITYPRKDVPLTEVGQTQESGFPWRSGTCRIFRLPFSRHAIALGKWTAMQPHENVDGIPSLSFRPLDHPEDYFHVLDERQDERPAF